MTISKKKHIKKIAQVKNKKIINVSLNKMDSKSSTVIKDEYDTAKYMTGMGYTDSLTGTLRMEAKQAAPYGEFIVKGQVSSATDKKYLSGISVIIKGKTIGTISDVNGNYMIRVSKTDKILIFIAKGYGSKEVEISGPGDINVELNPLK